MIGLERLAHVCKFKVSIIFTLIVRDKFFNSTSNNVNVLGFEKPFLQKLLL